MDFRIFNKILNRINFFFDNIGKMDWDAVWCSLQPADKRSLVCLPELLDKRKIIKWDPKNKTVSCGNKFFCYNENETLTDLVSIIMSGHPYIRKNFLDNEMYAFDGAYESGKVMLEKDDVVIDVGAHVGLFSVMAGEKVGPGGKIYSFEPVKESRDLLLKNLTANKIGNAIVAPYALGADNENLNIKMDYQNRGQSTGVMAGDTEFVRNVPQIKLDSFVRDNSLKRVDFIKADIEGMERDLISGASETIRRFKPKLSVCIYHLPDDPKVIYSLIRQLVPEYEITMTKTKLYASVPANIMNKC